MRDRVESRNRKTGTEKQGQPFIETGMIVRIIKAIESKEKGLMNQF